MRAASALEAWSIYCDTIKEWPSPQCERVIEHVKD
jgi:hypothetical protein